jgi:cell division septal protein FtsQ
MKLKPQPRPARRPARPARGAARRASGGRGKGARRPGVPLHRRIARRLPSLRRTVSALAAIAAAAALIALLNGPWLRVTEVSWAGEHYTRGDELERVLEPQRGASTLAVDTEALRARIERLPSVTGATVTASLVGRVEATIVEREPAFVWETSKARFLGAADGTIFAAVRLDDPLPAAASDLPRVTDQRFVARVVSIGDRVPEAILRTALELVEIDPVLFGSTATALSLRLDDEYGFRLASAEPGWEIAFGVYGLDPRETSAARLARLERQVTAVRTLFASRPEVEIGWVDVRNPGKVYFRAKG